MHVSQRNADVQYCMFSQDPGYQHGGIKAFETYKAEVIVRP